MAEGTKVKNFRSGKITIDDGTETYEVKFEDGNFQANIPGPTVDAYLDRGEFGATPQLRFSQDQPMTGQFSAHLRDITDAAYTTLADFLVRAGYVATDWASTLGANEEVPTVTITFDVIDARDASNHQIKFPFCYLTGSLQEGSPSTINMAWTSYAVRPSSAT